MKNYKEFAIDLVKKTGEIAKKEFYQTKKIGWKNSPHDGKSVVTETDVKLNKIINSTIKKRFPDHNIISEELKDIHNGSRYTWYIDPIDGTISFAQGFPFFCTTMGLAKDGKMILSAVYDPLHNELFVAEYGKGAYLNGKKFTSSARDSLRDAYFDVCIWPDSGIKLMPVFHRLMDRAWCGTKKECVILSACYAAIGRMDAVIFSGITPWDIATPTLIAKEAGLEVTDLWGGPVEKSGFTKGFIAAKPKLHAELLKLSKKCLGK